MTLLSSFQEKCSVDLKKLLEDFNLKTRAWEVVQGREEVYVEVDTGPIKIWIYADGACLRGGSTDRVFELADYDSIDALQRAFVVEVASALSDRGAK